MPIKQLSRVSTFRETSQMQRQARAAAVEAAGGETWDWDAAYREAIEEARKMPELAHLFESEVQPTPQPQPQPQTKPKRTAVSIAALARLDGKSELAEVNSIEDEPEVEMVEEIRLSTEPRVRVAGQDDVDDEIVPDVFEESEVEQDDVREQDAEPEQDIELSDESGDRGESE